MSTTPKEQKFAELYVTLGNASEAYRQAYNVTTTNLDTIKAKASKLLAKDNISTTIEKLKGELSETHGIDRAFILQGYLQIISDADYTFQLGADNAFYRIMNQTKNTDKIRALEAISKMMGLNEPEVIEHKHTVKTYKTNWG
jgi:phage terminase small subunit